MSVGIQNTMAASKPNFHVTNADINFSATEDLGGGLSITAKTGLSHETMRGGTNGVTNENMSLTMSGGFGTVMYQNVSSGKASMGSPSVEDDMSDVLGGYSDAEQFQYISPEVMPGLSFELEWTKVGANVPVSGTPQVVVNYKVGAATLYVDNGGSAKQWDARATYDFGAAKIAARTTKDKYQEFNVTVPMGAMTFGLYTASFTGGVKGSGFSASYALSKQTSLSLGYVSSKKAAGGTNTNGGNNYRVNLSKSF